MEYAKDEIFNIKYKNGKIFRKEKNIFSIIKNNKLISLIISITLVLCIANCMFIYNFFSVLSKL